MADLMAYWQYDNFLNDTRDGPGFHFNSSQQRLHRVPAIGSSLWLVTGRREAGRERLAYYLVGRLVIEAKTVNEPGYRYGKLRVHGCRTASQYYAPTTEASAMLRQLQFMPERPIGNAPWEIAQSLQTLRALAPEDSRRLAEWAEALPRLSSAAVLG